MVDVDGYVVPDDGDDVRTVTLARSGTNSHANVPGLEPGFNVYVAECPFCLSEIYVHYRVDGGALERDPPGGGLEESWCRHVWAVPSWESEDDALDGEEDRYGDDGEPAVAFRDVDGIGIGGMVIVIDGERDEVDEVYDSSGYLPQVRIGRREYFVARDCEHAGEAYREHMRDISRGDPSEFRCLVGEERIYDWAIGRGSFDDWLDEVANHPEEEFASYDGCELDVGEAGRDLVSALGFTPTVAYRCN